MIAIGLEGTAEKTGVGVVSSNGEILFNKTILYKPPLQGINPREAADHHGETFPKLIEEAFNVVSPKEIDLICFSQGPGLGPSLRVCATAARALALSLNKPILGVNHCIAHIEIGKLTTKATDPLTLYVSGGNTQVLGYSSGKYRVFGETLDIAIGNCLDQFARNCGLPHPGGMFVEQLANKSDKKYIKLPYSVKGMDIVFSGLLTYAIQQVAKGENLNNICYSLQETAFAMITEITERALAHTNKPEVMLVGGVAANNRLKEMLKIMSNEQSVNFYVPEPQYCGDNGAMIGWLGLLQYLNGSVMEIEHTIIKPYYRSDMVEVNWIKENNNKKYRQIPNYLIGKGAEANISKTNYLNWQCVVKERIPKNYRVKELDDTIRKERTIREVRYLHTIKDYGILSPFVYDVDKNNNIIIMDFISGEILKDIINKGDLSLCGKVGEIIGILHKNNIIHNDLTTSNFIVNNNNLYVIDFGLGNYSKEIEDKSIDLIVLKKAILSTHYNKFNEIINLIYDSYVKTYKEGQKVLNHIENIEKRARYV